MRYGYTTGTCAAAAAKGAALMVLGRKRIESVSVSLPNGEKRYVNLESQEITDNAASCGVIKDAGDDPDVTDGIMICAEVMLTNDTSSELGLMSTYAMKINARVMSTTKEGKQVKTPANCKISDKIMLTGGTGVGKVTRPGLENPVGEYAINKVPRAMILNEVQEVFETFEYDGCAVVTIYVPDGEEIAKKTFNSHLGIEGGISILGTTGLVKPMSTEALLETIRLDLSVKYAEGDRVALMVPGNYGESFLKEKYGINPDRLVHFSNYIGAAIDMAREIGFERVIITGHTGKMVKVTGGIMNTHSKEADCRMELMAAATLEASMSQEDSDEPAVYIKPEQQNKKISCIKQTEQKERTVYIRSAEEILKQINTTAALGILADNGILDSVCNKMLEKILYHLQKRAGDSMQVDCILYESSFGLLATSIENMEDLA